ncbi:MAG: hypothetical protein K5682_04550 [Lachnospiraceae bacterium]|nr:hypothetical protein [Lachnospiraceae bacterium]
MNTEKEYRTVVYVFTGLLDSGKTTAINDALFGGKVPLDGKTLILRTEDGEASYDLEKMQENEIALFEVDNPSMLDEELLETLDDVYKPDSVLIELNGMWDMTTLLNAQLPDGWGFGTVFNIINAQTYPMYVTNMRQMIMTPVSMADVVIFNRCDGNLNKGNIRRAIRILNDGAEVFFMRPDGTLDREEEPYVAPEKDGILEIDETQFCSWFVDCIENTDRYLGKKVHLFGFVAQGRDLPQHQFYFGRMASICCAADARFIGFTSEYAGEELPAGTWCDITATVENRKVNEKQALIFLRIERLEKAQAPADVYLYLS